MVTKLTKRENEVMSLLNEGYTAQEVANALFLSKRTVDFHTANVYDKLRVHNLTKALNVLYPRSK